MENTEKKLTVTLEGATEGPKVFDELEGVILLLRTPLGVTRIICGGLSFTDMAMMIKSLYSGDDEITKKLKLARAVSEIAPEFSKENTVEIDETEMDKVNNHFKDLIETIREKMKGAEA